MADAYTAHDLTPPHPNKHTTHTSRSSSEQCDTRYSCQMEGTGDISALVGFEVYMEISDRVCNNKESDLQPCFLPPCVCVCVLVGARACETTLYKNVPVNHSYCSYFLLDISDTVIKSRGKDK